VARTKPHPDCFLLADDTLDIPVERCVVFEDSFHGLEAANRAGMKVVGLATTNPADAIVDKCEVVISDFVGFSYEKMMGVL
jgi:beta-phosphoglucomutase-like phosphatase (HAD superfamily)